MEENSSRKRFRRLNTRESGTDPWTARILNTHGPRMRPDDGGVLPMSLSGALFGKTALSKRRHPKPFCNVSNLVTALHALADVEMRPPRPLQPRIGR
jgi:nucleoside-diphosphate-sugar epimerase